MVASEFDLGTCVDILDSLDEQKIREILLYENVKEFIKARLPLILHSTSKSLECMKLVMDSLNLTFKDVDPSVLHRQVDFRVILEFEKVGIPVIRSFIDSGLVSLSSCSDVEDKYVSDLIQILIREDYPVFLFEVIHKRLTTEEYFDLLDKAFQERSLDCVHVLIDKIWNHLDNERYTFRGTDELFSIFLKHRDQLSYFAMNSMDPWAWFFFRLERAPISRRRRRRGNRDNRTN
jgi:hypothetical protein